MYSNIKMVLISNTALNVSAKGVEGGVSMCITTQAIEAALLIKAFFKNKEITWEGSLMQ